MGKWRLPTVSELQNAFDYEKGAPKIGGFTPDQYWSSTAFAGYKETIWIVNLRDGYAEFNYKTYPYCVRCVRQKDDGELEWSKPSDREMVWDEAREYCEALNTKEGGGGL